MIAAFRSFDSALRPDPRPFQIGRLILHNEDTLYDGSLERQDRFKSQRIVTPGGLGVAHEHMVVRIVVTELYPDDRRAGHLELLRQGEFEIPGARA